MYYTVIMPTLRVWHATPLALMLKTSISRHNSHGVNTLSQDLRPPHARHSFIKAARPPRLLRVLLRRTRYLKLLLENVQVDKERYTRQHDPATEQDGHSPGRYRYREEATP